jgi:hypothetical protein
MGQYVIVETVFGSEYKIATISHRFVGDTECVMLLADTYYMGEIIENSPRTARTNRFSTYELAEQAVKELRTDIDKLIEGGCSMGFYINTPVVIGKAGWLKKNHNAIEIPEPVNFHSFDSETNGLVCVVENPMFDAAGYIFDDNELNRARPNKFDNRKRTWLLMNKAVAMEISGYDPKKVTDV